MKYNENSVLFLEYIIEIGKFNPNNYGRILELGQSVPNSMSIFLKNYRQYLLSSDVQYHELDEYGIDGAFGYIKQNEIFVPKSLENDEHFIYNAPKSLFPRHGYDYPTINKFDSIICEGLNANLLDIVGLNQDKFFGVCIDLIDNKNANREQLHRRIQQLSAIGTLLNFMNSGSRDKFEISHDIVSEKSKELYLIKKSK